MKNICCDHHELAEFPAHFQEKEVYKICSDLYAPERKINDLITCFHKAYMSGTWSLEQLETQIWKVFWVNPLIAVRMFESCCLYESVDIYGALKSVWYGLIHEKAEGAPYGLYSKEGGACLSGRNLYFIYYHIPNAYKIKFLNWFCRKYRYEASLKRTNAYGKSTTEKPLRCINTIVDETRTDCLWKYMNEENGSEYAEVVQILREEHEDFISSILGSDDLDKKIELIEAYEG